jgi:CubicO group peptidase (beta-lactamase class C family)
MTKPITAVALMTLYDEGKFKLDDKVSNYIPEFEGILVYTSNDDGFTLEPQANEMTIRHLLTHTSGISYGWNRESYVDSLYRVNNVGNWNQSLQDQIKKLSEMPLNFQPGTNYEYGLSIDVAGYLVEVFSEMTLDKYFKTRIFDPLKMKDSGFFVPEDQQDRLSELFILDKDGTFVGPEDTWKDAFKKSPTLFSGGGGLVSTLNDYARFCKMLLNGGKLDGVRILEESTAKLVISNQMPQEASFKEDNGYGLGGSVNLKTNEYAWGGMASTNFWIDPENDMIIITFAQLLPGNHSYAYVFKDLVNRALISSN